MKDIDGKDNRFLISLDSIIIVNKKTQSNDKNVYDQKQNMTIDNDIVTPKKLDQEAEDILGSLENDVMKILKKTKYFDKTSEE